MYNSDTYRTTSALSAVASSICFGFYAQSWLVGCGVFFAFMALADVSARAFTAILEGVLRSPPSRR